MLTRSRCLTITTGHTLQYFDLVTFRETSTLLLAFLLLMSVPQNNLDDLKRRAHAGHSTGHVAQLPDGGGQPKVPFSCRYSFSLRTNSPLQNFKFKSAAGFTRSPATIPTSGKPTRMPNGNPQEQSLLAEQTKPPHNHAKRSRSQTDHLNHKSPTKIDNSPLTKSITNIPANTSVSPSASWSSSQSNVPLKRPTPTNDVMSSGGSTKRPKTLHSTKAVNDENTMDTERHASHGTSKCQVTKSFQPSCPTPPTTTLNSDISPVLLADYETVTTLYQPFLFRSLCFFLALTGTFAYDVNE
ncbi:hypothetical protein JB92DRAFT_1677030 [Gautieria morchelliformis]|nr:hypothetical protein JB92DRAFT_1677030 [Gautieria morchelliformis]